MKSSDAYSGAVARANSDANVIAVLGSPLKEGIFFRGNISEQNSSGNANLTIPIKGPKGSGELYVLAHRSLGQWYFDQLMVQVDATKQRIDLIDTNQLQAVTTATNL